MDGGVRGGWFDNPDVKPEGGDNLFEGEGDTEEEKREGRRHLPQKSVLFKSSVYRKA